ncbi:MAG TPA: hypothetical protein VLF94_08860 [Chlamydiales bacterium]|nr:hypothetical protein [Chlamydiales bacterium]
MITIPNNISPNQLENYYSSLASDVESSKEEIKHLKEMLSSYAKKLDLTQENCLSNIGYPTLTDLEGKAADTAEKIKDHLDFFDTLKHFDAPEMNAQKEKIHSNIEQILNCNSQNQGQIQMMKNIIFKVQELNLFLNRKNKEANGVAQELALFAEICATVGPNLQTDYREHMCLKLTEFDQLTSETAKIIENLSLQFQQSDIPEMMMRYNEWRVNSQSHVDSISEKNTKNRERIEMILQKILGWCQQVEL